MTRETLLTFIKSSVRVTVDGKEAMAILRVDPNRNLTLTAHCFLHAAEECPLMVHPLTAEETHMIHLEGAALVSSVRLQSSSPECLPPPEGEAGPDASIKEAVR